ncbi:unnamed protein product [Aphanomyces euteiches]
MMATSAASPMGNCSYSLETGPLAINYLEFHYCVMAEHPWMSFTMLCMWLLLLFYLVGHTADEYFSPTLSTLCRKLAIPFDVAGVTLLAFGNGAPDIFSSLATSTSGTMETGVNALLGGVMFVTTVVVGAVLQSSPLACVKITPRPFCRDILALLITLGILAIDLPTSTSSMSSAMLLLSCYVVYVLAVVVPSWLSSKTNAQTTSDPYTHGVLFAFWHAPELFPTVRTKYSFVSVPESSPLPSAPAFHVDEAYFPAPTSSELATPLLDTSIKAEITPHATPRQVLASTSSTLHYILLDLLRNATIPMVLVSSWSRRRAFCSVLISPLFVCWIFSRGAFSLHDALICLSISMPIACIVYLSTYPKTAPTSRWICWLFYLLGFVSCVGWIYGLASEVVAVLTTLGVITTLPASVLGLTVLSWGNSIGDLSTNVAIAKGGCAEMALAGCFGGPVFNLLVGLGIPFLFLQKSNQTSIVPWDIHGIVSLISLGLSLLLTLSIGIVYKFSCPKWYGKVLYGLYVIYTAVHVAILCRWI